MKLSEKLGNKVRILREVNNYTQDYVAGILDISSSTYSLMEKGQATFSIERLEKLAVLYNISLIDLINQSDQNIFGTITNSATHNVSDAITINNGLTEEERNLYKTSITHLEMLNEKLMKLIDKLSDKLG